MYQGRPAQSPRDTTGRWQHSRRKWSSMMPSAIRAQPLAAVSEHLLRAMVEIEMPQGTRRTRLLRSCGPRRVVPSFFRHDLTRGVPWAEKLRLLGAPQP